MAQRRLAQVEAALAELPKVQAVKAAHNGHKNRDKTPRVSTTDPEARTMKMPDGGFRPAYNVQLAADTVSRAILAVEVSNVGSDQPLSAPVRRQVEERTGQPVGEHLLDGGFVKLEAITQATQAGVCVYAPPKKTPTNPDPYAPQSYDSPEVAAWRARMATPQAQAIYRLRAATSETVNADLRTYRGLGPFVVRGLARVRCVALWSALAYNLMHFGRQLL